MMLPLGEAVRVHAVWSGIAVVIGVIIFFAKNHPGTKRSRWQGYWILGTGMVFYQGCTAPALLAPGPQGVHIYSLAIPLWAMVGGLIVGAVAGKISGRVMFGDNDQLPTQDDDDGHPPRG
jgi:hypothetical protein